MAITSQEAIEAKETVLLQTQRGICAVVAVSGESFASSNTAGLASSARAWAKRNAI